MAKLYLKGVESGRRQPSKMLRHSDIIITSLKKELLNSFVDVAPGRYLHFSLRVTKG